MTVIKQIFSIDELLEWRREVIKNVFGEEPSAELLASNESFYKRHIPDGSHLAFLAMEDGEEVGCGALCLTEELPSPDNPSGKCGYLMNIYVRAPYREKGIGHRIVKHLIQEAKAANCGKIYLETTPEGRPVYKSLGFHDLPDMMKLSEN